MKGVRRDCVAGVTRHPTCGAAAGVVRSSYALQPVSLELLVIFELLCLYVAGQAAYVEAVINPDEFWLVIVTRGDVRKLEDGPRQSFILPMALQLCEK